MTQLLERLNEVVEKSNLFDPDHAGPEEELESLRRHLESLGSSSSSSGPSAVETQFASHTGGSGSSPVGKGRPGCSCLSLLVARRLLLWGQAELLPCLRSLPCPVSPSPHLPPFPPSLAAPGFSLDAIAKDKTELHRFLMQNLSLSNETVGLLTGSSINLREVSGGGAEAERGGGVCQLQAQTWRDNQAAGLGGRGGKGVAGGQRLRVLSVGLPARLWHVSRVCRWLWPSGHTTSPGGEALCCWS